MDGGKGAIYYPNLKAGSTSLIHFMTSGSSSLFHFWPAQSRNFSFGHGHLSEYYKEDTVRCGFTFCQRSFEKVDFGVLYVYGLD